MTLEGFENPCAKHAKHTEPSTDPGRLKLLARCGDTYLATRVRLVPGVGTMRVAGVSVAVPDHVLPGHHQGLVPVGMLPIAFDLVQDHFLLGTAATIARVCNKEAGAMSWDGGSGNAPRWSAWWWGSTGSNVQAALNDLHAMTDTAWADQTGEHYVKP